MHPMIPKPKQLLLQEMNNTVMIKCKCPFLEYAGDTTSLISCSDECVTKYFGITQRFNNKHEKFNYISNYCAWKYKECDVYKIFCKRGGYDEC